MSVKDKIIRNVFSNWAGLVVNIGISFFLAPFIVHKLGNSNYGIWVIMMQFTGYLYLLDFGVRESIIRYVSKYESKQNTKELNAVLSAGIILYCAIGLFSFLITLVLAFSFPYVFNIEATDITTAKIVVILSGLTIAQTLAFNVFSGILMGLQRYDIFNKVGIIFAFIRLALILIFLNLGYSLIALAIIQLVMGIGNNLAIYFYSRNLLKVHNIPFHYTKASWAERLPIFKKLYNYSIYVLINNLGQKAIYYTDALIIGIFLSTSAVTFYAIAGNLIEYLRRLIMLSTSVLNPVASELDGKQESEKINKLLIEGCRLSFMLALPIGITYLTMGREFIGLWMGQEYSTRSGDVLLILTVTILLSIPQNTISSILYGISKHHIIAKLRIAEAISNLLLSLILVTYLGIAGVALGTAIPQIIIMGIILPLIISKELKISIKEYLSRVYLLPILGSSPFILLSYFVNHTYPTESMIVFFLQVLLLLPVYFLSISIVCFSKTERSSHIQMVSRLIRFRKNQ